MYVVDMSTLKDGLDGVKYGKNRNPETINQWLLVTPSGRVYGGWQATITYLATSRNQECKAWRARADSGNFEE